MLIRNYTTTLLEIHFEFMLCSKVISKGFIGPDDLFKDISGVNWLRYFKSTISITISIFNENGKPGLF